MMEKIALGAAWMWPSRCHREYQAGSLPVSAATLPSSNWLGHRPFTAKILWDHTPLGVQMLL